MSRVRLNRPNSLLFTGAVGAALAAIALWSAGCSSSDTSDTDAETPAAGMSGTDAPMGDSADGSPEAALAALSPEDRAVADAQQICPLSKQPLGSMGTPVKVEYQGKPVFLCCEHCQESFEADPEKYIANLPNWQDEAAPTSDGTSTPEGAAPEGTAPESGEGDSAAPGSTETPATGESSGS